METKKEDKKSDEKSQHQTIGNFENTIFEITQSLITYLQKKDGFERALEDLTKNKFPKLQQLYNEEKQKNDELTDTLKRLQAEFENFKKRIEKEKIEFVKYAHADIIANMLPVLDSFEIALKNTNDKEKFVEGVKMIYAQFYSILGAEGLTPIKAVGEKFDPYKHEVLMKEESEKPEEAILEEFQKGYLLNGGVIRHSKVKISGK